MPAGYWALEDGSGNWQLEDGSGNWLLDGNYEFNAEPAAYAVTVSDATLAKSYQLSVDPAAYALAYEAGSGGGFVVDAAEFDGSTYLSRAAFMSDGRQVTITGFFNATSVGDYQFLVSATTNCYIAITDLGELEFYAGDSTDTTYIDVYSSVSGLDDGAWHSFCISVDTNFSAGNKLVSLVIDRAVDTPTIFDASAAFDINMSAGTAYVGYSSSSFFLNGCMAEATCNPEYIDFSNSANLNKFVTTGNKPENIGADGSTAYGAACAMYLHLDDAESAANFALNAGTGGNFTVTGTLATCATSPSDGGGGGTETEFVVVRAIVASPAIYALTVADATLLKTRIFNAEPASYTVNVQDAALMRGYQMLADPASYTVSVPDATTLLGKAMTASPASYTVTVPDATTPINRAITASPAAYTLTVNDAALLTARTLSLDPLVFTLTLADADLVHDVGTPPAGGDSDWIVTTRRRRRG